jgi:hypothetical protein
MNHRVRERLHAGETIVVFAEGTTTDGFSLLPFHSNLIAPAIEVGCEIWPVALRYTLRGAQTAAAAFIGEMGLVTSLWNILVAPGIVIEIAYLAPLQVTPDRTRHHLARHARAEIATHLGFDPESASTEGGAPHVSPASNSAGESASATGASAAPTNPRAALPGDTAPARSPARANASQ